MGRIESAQFVPSVAAGNLRLKTIFGRLFMTYATRARAYAPASVGNILCGFDVFGLALERPGDVVEARRCSAPGVTIVAIHGDGGRLPTDPDQMLLSGTLDGGEALAGRPQVIDAPVGDGHVVMFSIRPFWRWQTQGTFFLGFNTILNWNDLDATGADPEPITDQTPANH